LEKKVSENKDKPTLRIYFGRHCWSCEEALRLGQECIEQFTNVNVELIDLDEEGSVNADDVFSVPTYVLDGRVLSLGNPTASHLFERLKLALSS
jgi:Thioredoxin domain